MSNTFRKAYRALSGAEIAAVESIKTKAEALEVEIKKLFPSRETSLAMTKLEEAVMWAVKAVTG